MAGRKILEPSAGTGNLIEAAVNDATGFDCCQITAVEVNYNVVQALMDRRSRWLHANSDTFKIVHRDFLECTPEELGMFHVILMNPPFDHGLDVKHVEHAVKFMRPGGRLVAIVANGSKQQKAFRDLADQWIDLPAGSFKNQGTNVNTAMFLLTRPEK